MSNVLKRLSFTDSCFYMIDLPSEKESSLMLDWKLKKWEKNDNNSAKQGVETTGGKAGTIIIPGLTRGDK